MATMHIARLNQRYRLPPRAFGAKQRLDSIFRAAVVPLLDTALDSLDARAHEEVCIRAVDVRATLQLASPDSTLAADWCASIATAIEKALKSGDILRYRSRSAALVELAGAASTYDFSRVWAWRQIGIWRAAEQPTHLTIAQDVLKTLAAEPSAACAVLREVARRDQLPELLAASVASWEQLARAVLIAAGCGARLIDDGAANDSPDADRTIDAVVLGADRILRHSLILRAAVRARGGPTVLSLLRPLAVLGVFEVEPAIVAVPSRRVRELIAAIERAIGVAAQAPANRIDGGKSVRPGNDPAPLKGAIEDVASRGDERQLETTVDDNRKAAETSQAGLFFLLRLVDALGLPAGIVADMAFASRSLVWVLHRLALMLAPLSDDDPAALGFAGLRPDEPPPSIDVPVRTQQELAALTALRARIVAGLRQSLARETKSEDELLAAICYRRAEVVADPGWIEVCFSLDDVSTEIRRAGLDLDPGWLPWLGVVMRFSYV